MPLSENALNILQERYLQPGETVEQLWDRLSFGRADFREMLSEGWFLPNSPTIFNLGVANGGTLSACFKFDVPDTLDGIMDVARKAALVLKAGGGVGYTVSQVRPQGALVNSTHGKALGPVSVLDIYQNLAHNLTQGGKREGAQMGILAVDHPDVLKFIHMKDEEPDKYETFNISVAITDEFMRKVIEQANTPLPITDRPEYDLFMEMANSAWRTGDPGVYFIDTAERANPTPWLGKLTGTNPCGEVPLLDNEPCNLGSLNLSKFLNKTTFDYTTLDNYVSLAIEYLDMVLDANVFPDPAIDEIARKTRKLGLGVCGLADVFTSMQIQYDSNDAVEFSEIISSRIQNQAGKTSAVLAGKLGVAPAFEGKKIGLIRRNATVTCIAPTGTISQLMDASSGIEPYFALENTRRRMDMKTGEWIVTTEKVNAPDGFVPHTAMEIAAEWHIRHQAAWQANVDLAVSKTINLPNSATPQDIFNAWIMMWKMGCKGGTVYRDGSRAIQVLETFSSQHDGEPIPQSYVEAGIQALQVVTHQHGRKKLMPKRHATTRKFEIDGVEGYITVGEYEDGSPGELFLNVSRQGSTVDGLYDSIAILTSLALQYGVPLSSLVEKFAGTKFEPAGFTGDADIPTANSIIDYIFRRVGLDYLGRENTIQTTVINKNGVLCPDCGSEVVFQEGCMHCNNCGWERC